MASFSPLSRDMTGTIRRKGLEITLTPREKQAYGSLWKAADVDGNGFITGADAVPFFAKSGLSPEILGQIWVLADADNKGVLNQQGFSIALKLIAHAQTGKTPSAALINVDAPLPRFEGLTGPSDSPSIAAASGSASVAAGAVHPPITPEDKTRYGNMFLACGPVGGLLDGQKAREVFLKSNLPVEKLGQIWNLADTKQRGSLDLTDFTIAMYYIQHSLNGSIPTLPATLPPQVLKACTTTNVLSSPVPSNQALPRQATGGASGHLPRQMTGSFGLSSSPLPKQLTGGQVSSSATSVFGLGSSTSLPSLDMTWDISPEEKAKFDRFFDQLDKTGSGSLSGEEASKFFMNSRLPESILAQIWDLADITKSGSLSKDEFAVAMYLINRKNAQGIPIPKVLPPTLVPPSLRTRSLLTSSLSDPLRGTSGLASTHNRRQSFDLLGDGPVATHTTGPSGVADKETEELQSKITAATGELASLQNQINNLSQTTGDLQHQRQMLEQQLSSLSSQKHDISIRLNQIKTLHENETKTIKDLQNTIATLQPQTLKLREELITSERELALARSQKDEYLLSVARDREESEQIKAKLKQNQEETTKLRQELEAMKKDTTRQKSLLEISRRQLATSEAEKQKLRDEIEGLEHSRQGSSTSSPQAPPPPAPRGSRKEPPPPPASRGSNFAKVSPEMEEAFGIPQALRSPTGSFHETSKAPSITSISRQSTGTSPFEAIPRQTTGTSPFEQIARQDTGMSGKTASIKSNSGGAASSFLEAGNTSATTAMDGNLWSPMTHAASAAAAGGSGIEVTKSPDPLDSGNDAFDPARSLATFASTVPLPISPPTSQDPFSSMAFPAMDTPAVTKVDFDEAFQGFSTGGTGGNSGKSGDGLEGVKSAEAFAEAFPEIDPMGNSPTGAGKRVSAFGFDDDFTASLPAATETTAASASAPTSKRTIKEEDEDEFPPIVQMQPQEEDSSDDEDDDAFVQASSHIATPDPTGPTSTATTQAAVAPAEASSSTASAAPAAPAPAPATASAPGSRKWTTADFEEFESKLGGADGFGADDFLSTTAGSGGTGSGQTASKNAFDSSGFDFNMSFDDAFGPSTTGTTAAAPKPSSSTAGANSTPFGDVDFGMGFGQPAKPIDLDEAFGGAFGGSSSTSTGAAGTSSGAAGFDGFDDGFGSTTTPAAAPSTTAVTTTATTTTSAPAPPTSSTNPPTTAPNVDLQGVDELMSMGFTRQQANDALSRYDTVERAANFLLEGGAN
ncbi:hypothetical protein BGW41_002318 [Actinomortierella wolfii]|nr:hypothetical protein BGW41_002318 [Actinomortierella wolfii]